MAEAAHNLAVDDNAEPHALGHRDVNEAVGALLPARAQPQMRQGAGDRCVIDVYREPGREGEVVANIDVAPTQLGGVQDAPRVTVHHARDHDADTLAFASGTMLVEHPGDPGSHLFHQRGGIGHRLEALQRQLPPGEVGEKQEYPAEANVHADHVAVAGADVQQGGPPATGGGRGCALVD
jgi:hypothetical protein